MGRKKRVALLFGGQSSEHEVSCLSAATVARNVSGEKYELLLIGITKEGRWLKVDSVDAIESGAWREGKIGAALLPDASLKSVLLSGGGEYSLLPVDVVFPMLHGLWGEDGCPQGIAEMAQIPYVGCNVESSAVTMDKVATKAILERLGVPQAPYLAFRREELADLDAAAEKISRALGFPVFVKPSNAGSSCGISCASNLEELKTALQLAITHDYKVVIEAKVVGRELECAVLGGWNAKASGVGEILAATDFYDYDAKYNSSESKTVIDPILPDGSCEEIRSWAVKIFRALDCSGLSRVDFFLSDDGRVIFNEINTIPGFTAISMYPKLWEAAGISLSSLIEKLIESASVTKRTT